MDLGPHGFFIAAAYAATAVMVSALILRAVLDHRAQVRALAELEARGVTRRSQTAPPGLGKSAPRESPLGASGGG